MKTLLILLSILVLPGLAFTAEILEKVESEVYATEGTKEELTNRAKQCIASIVRNDEVRISDSSASSGGIIGSLASSMAGDAGKKGHSSGLHGGDVFVNVDIETGLITANNRVDYDSHVMIHDNVKSTFTFLAKEGRFKIRHTNIESVQKDTGTMHNKGYSPVAKVWGTGWKKAVTALEGVSNNVASCVQNGPQEEEW